MREWRDLSTWWVEKMMMMVMTTTMTTTTITETGRDKQKSEDAHLPSFDSFKAGLYF